MAVAPESTPADGANLSTNDRNGVGNWGGGSRWWRTAALGACYNGAVASLVAPHRRLRTPPARAMGDAVLVVPCFDESRRLDLEAFRRFRAAGHPQRFLFVDDGSRDTTAERIEALCRRAPDHFSLMRLVPNRGKAEAVRQGILRAFGDQPAQVGFWDADLATPLEAIPRFSHLLDTQRHLKIVLGSRVQLLGHDIRRRAVRHYLGRGFATAVSMILGLAVYDTQCGAKLFRADAEVYRLFVEPFCTRWVFDVELLARFVAGRRKQGGRPADEAIRELPLHRWHDVAGSKLRTADFLRAAWELGVIYRRYSRR